jgi:hypothetical protein
MPSTFVSTAVRLSMFFSPAKVVSVLLVGPSILRTELIQSLPNLSIVLIDILSSLFPRSYESFSRGIENYLVSFSRPALILFSLGLPVLTSLKTLNLEWFLPCILLAEI